MIKYRYALLNNKIADIHKVQDGIFYCINCGCKMIPVRGNARQWHFRHQQKVICSNESYLHKLAKYYIYNTYLECLNQSIPFMIRLENTIKYIDIDLCDFFPIIKLESNCKGFRPDILLVNNKDEFLFIEICVTHKISEEKHQSGIRIIEFYINSEKELNNIFSQCKFYNFNLTKAFEQKSTITKDVYEYVMKKISWVNFYGSVFKKLWDNESISWKIEDDQLIVQCFSRSSFDQLKPYKRHIIACFNDGLNIYINDIIFVDHLFNNISNELISQPIFERKEPIIELNGFKINEKVYYLDNDKIVYIITDFLPNQNQVLLKKWGNKSSNTFYAKLSDISRCLLF